MSTRTSIWSFLNSMAKDVRHENSTHMRTPSTKSRTRLTNHGTTTVLRRRLVKSPASPGNDRDAATKNDAEENEKALHRHFWFVRCSSRVRNNVEGYWHAPRSCLLVWRR